MSYKLVAAVLDDKASRLKALVSRKGKKEALAFVDEDTQLNLVQIAAISGNVPAGQPLCPLLPYAPDCTVNSSCTCSYIFRACAAEYLIVCGASVNVRWTPRVLPPTMVLRDAAYPGISGERRLRFRRASYNLFQRNLARDAWEQGALSLLHMAVRCPSSAGWGDASMARTM